ncbi:predicted protein, partial [Nematostella vectensis]
MTCANCTGCVPLVYDKCSKQALGTLFLSFLDESSWNQGLRTFIYLIALLWCFMGVAIVADIFMCAIETITSKTKKVKIAKQNSSEIIEVEVRVWNETVANLTLMALGSSAPEILLSIIEITIMNGFEAGALGPSTIVGSAAFNLLCITGVCVMAVPKFETRRIKSMNVFAVTAITSLLAYIWLFIILSVNTKDVVELWEAILTFLFFPILVIIAYIMDKNYCCPGRVEPEGMLELGDNSHGELFVISKIFLMILNKIMKNEVSQIPDITEDDTAKLVAAHIKAKQPKNYGYYRVGAIRNIGGGHKLKPKMDPRLNMIYEELSEVGFSTSGASTILHGKKDAIKPAVIEFATTKCAVMENDKLVKIGVMRSGNLNVSASVNFETIDGTAESGSDYVAKKDVMVFKPGETLKHLDIEIIDDNEWEENEIFFVKLAPYDMKDAGTVVGKQSITEITIINDDEPGVLSLQKPSFVIKESIGKANFLVERTGGTDGTIKVTWKTTDQSAINGKDYHGGIGELVFEHGEQMKDITIEIMDDKAFEKDECFLLEIMDPTGGATLGKITRSVVTIVNDDEYKRLFDRVVALTHLNLDRLELGSSSWGQQFRDALSVNGGDIENATTMDYIMHFLTLAWKVIFAAVPPCTWAGGWVTFSVALCFIGILTAIVGDLATIFGCLVGLKNEVTAFTFVALGTSLPDLFASKAAAINEKYADACIGNVTGSNSVNVFLGLGTPWVIATIY